MTIMTTFHIFDPDEASRILMELRQCVKNKSLVFKNQARTCVSQLHLLIFRSPSFGALMKEATRTSAWMKPS